VNEINDDPDPEKKSVKASDKEEDKSALEEDKSALEQDNKVEVILKQWPYAYFA